MSRALTWTAAPLLTFAVLLTLPQRGVPQANAPQPDILDQTIEMKLFHQPDLTLGGVLDVIQQKLQKEGKKLPIFIDIHAFKVADPDFTDNIYETKVRFPPFPPELSISIALRLALSKVATKNATFVVMPDHLLITTVEKATKK
jgi:hypothetical protein